MREYLVEWRIDIEADSPEEAAAQALVCQRDTESTAVVFDVFDENGEMVTVDLLDSGE
jgi:hypothetical protein